MDPFFASRLPVKEEHIPGELERREREREKQRGRKIKRERRLFHVLVSIDYEMNEFFRSFCNYYYYVIFVLKQKEF